MHDYIQISKLNDFVFCPYSLYLHSIYNAFDKSTYQDTPQKRGTLAHSSIDTNTYSSSKRYLQGIPISSQKLKLIGKIDLLDTQTKTLIERKYLLKKIYDGYRYQLYAQYFCLREMGHEVDNLCIHSLKDNKRHNINIPDSIETDKFYELIESIQKFSVLHSEFTQTAPEKCKNCIYAPLCSKSVC